MKRGDSKYQEDVKPRQFVIRYQESRNYLKNEGGMYSFEDIDSRTLVFGGEPSARKYANMFVSNRPQYQGRLRIVEIK